MRTLHGEHRGYAWIRPKYFERYPNSPRARWWQQQLFVIIKTEHGFWRHEAKGYTMDPDDIGTGHFTFTEAMKYVDGLGPEKHARLWALKGS